MRLQNGFQPVVNRRLLKTSFFVVLARHRLLHRYLDAGNLKMRSKIYGLAFGLNFLHGFTKKAIFLHIINYSFYIIQHIHTQRFFLSDLFEEHKEQRELFLKSMSFSSHFSILVFRWFWLTKLRKYQNIM